MPDIRSAIKLNNLPLKNLVGSGASVNVYALAAASSGALSSFTVETDIPSTSISVVVAGSNATVILIATFGFGVTSSGVTMTGFINWNTADLTPHAVLTSNASTNLVPVSQTCVVTGVTAGTYTAKLRASSSISAAGNQVISGLSNLTVLVLGNS